MIAAVLTVKNEAQMLSVHCDYHRALGVSRFYVFDDGSTDGCTEALAHHPDVTVLASADARRAMGENKSLGIFEAHWHHELNARKGLNAQYAAMLARRSGCEWLINIDPDEFLFLDLARTAKRLQSFFDVVPAECDMVAFPNYEVMQTANEGVAFWTNVHFKSMYVRSSDGITQSSFRRLVHNPFAKISWWVDGYYGHSSGKSAVRLSRRDWQWHPSGHWATNSAGAALRAFDANNATGFHAGIAHFFCTDYRAFLVKFQNYAGTIPDPRINNRASLPTKTTWISVVNSGRLSDDELRDYFRRWIVIGDEEIRKAQESAINGALTITSIRDALVGADGIPGAAPLGNVSDPSESTALGGHYLLTWRRRQHVMQRAEASI